LTLFTKKLPDVSAFKVFGATSYALDGQHPAGKLSPQAVRCKFLGYSTESGKPSAILLTASGRIFTSRDIAVNADSIRGSPESPSTYAIFDDLPASWSSNPLPCPDSTDPSTPDAPPAKSLATDTQLPSRLARPTPAVSSPSVPFVSPSSSDFSELSVPTLCPEFLPAPDLGPGPGPVPDPGVAGPMRSSSRPHRPPERFMPAGYNPAPPSGSVGAVGVMGNDMQDVTVLIPPLLIPPGVADPLRRSSRTHHEPDRFSASHHSTDLANSQQRLAVNVSEDDILDRAMPAIKLHQQAVEWEKMQEFAMASLFMAPEPRSFREAILSPEWQASMDKEIQCMKDQHVWDEVLLSTVPVGTPIIDNKWVYRNKLGINDGPDVLKSRTVARGDQQDQQDDTFAPVTRFEAVRLMFALAVALDLECTVSDVPVAFLNAPIPADKPQVFMRFPKGYEKEGYCVKLNKCIYGLQESPKYWNEMLHAEMIQLGFTASKVDPCLYVKLSPDGVTKLFVLVYVDDLMTVGTEAMVNEFEGAMFKRFQIKRHGPITSYCGLDFVRNRADRTGEIKMEKYIEKMLKTFALEDINPSSLPYKEGMKIDAPDPGYIKSNPMTEEERKKMSRIPYRSLVASLNWISSMLRFDITFTVKKLTQNFNEPRMIHWEAAKTVLAYLKRTKHIGIKVNSNKSTNPDPVLMTYCDADWASDRATRKSTTGVITMVFNTPVSWKVHIQKSVASSTMEAEYMGLAEATKETLYIRALLKEYGFEQKTATPIWEDNNAAVILARDPKFHARSKHIDIAYHLTRDYQQQGKISVFRCPTKMMMADLLTKYIGKDTLEHCHLCTAGYRPLEIPIKAYDKYCQGKTVNR